MTLYHDLIDVASKKLKILIFYHFIDVVHEAVECDKQISGDFVLFLTPLKEVLFDSNKCFEEQRQFFVRHCLKYLEVFHSMFRIKKGSNECSAIFWEGHKTILN